MNIALWVIAAVLASTMLAAGTMKVSRPRSELEANGMPWVDDFPGRTVKTIGALEILAAIGLLVPAALDIAPWLVPAAAIGVIAVMVGAAVTHLRRSEPQAIAINAILLALAAFVAWGRFGPHAF